MIAIGKFCALFNLYCPHGLHVSPCCPRRFPGLPCRVFNTGEIAWNPGVIIHSSCDLDVTYFPMDTQVIIV